jgi:hypothetical protein
MSKSLALTSATIPALWEELDSMKPKVNLPTQLEKVRPYNWHEKKNMRNFAHNFKKAVHCHYNGFRGKAKQYANLCLEIFAADRADTTLALAKRMGARQVRLFAVAEPRKNIRVEGRGPFDWRLVPVDSHQGDIPLEHLERLSALRIAGAPEPDGFSIAEPVHKPQPVRRELKDPVLLIRYGKWWCEIGRWD